MKVLERRLTKLEVRSGLVETPESRRDAELGEILRRRINARRARQGLPPLVRDDAEIEAVRGLSMSEILNRGRDLARAKRLKAIELEGVAPGASGES